MDFNLRTHRHIKLFMKRTKNKPLSAHHDALFKFCFSSARFARELFQLALSKEEQVIFDWDKLKPEKDSFKDLRADLVFSVPFKNKPSRQAKLCLLLEHKSRFSRRVYHQILKYKTLIIGESLEKAEEDCLVIAIVFYHGKEPWRQPKSFKKGLWGEILPLIPSSLAKNMLDYELRVLDTHDPRLEKVIADKNFKSRGFLSALKKVWSLKAEEEELNRVIALFDNWPGDKEDLSLSVGDYLWSSVRGMTPKLWEKLEQEAVKKGIFLKGGYMNIREYIKEEGRQEGRQEGMQRGMQQVILNMLREKADIDFICKVTGLAEKEIKKLQNGSG